MRFSAKEIREITGYTLSPAMIAVITSRFTATSPLTGNARTRRALRRIGLAIWLDRGDGPASYLTDAGVRTRHAINDAYEYGADAARTARLAAESRASMAR